MTVCGKRPAEGGTKMQWNKIVIPKMKSKRIIKESEGYSAKGESYEIEECVQMLENGPSVHGSGIAVSIFVDFTSILF